MESSKTHTRVHVENATLGPFDLGEVKRLKKLIDLSAEFGLKEDFLEPSEADLLKRLGDYFQSVVNERTNPGRMF
jgi:hypothetical protein